MLLSAVSVLVVAQSSSVIPEGLTNNHVCPEHSLDFGIYDNTFVFKKIVIYSTYTNGLYLLTPSWYYLKFD